MKTTNLSFLVKDGHVLLAMKKRGFGVGKWNGAGGKVKEKETVEASAMREIKEEIGVDVRIEDLRFAGKLQFEFEEMPDWKQESFVFIVNRWTGEPSESEEMRPQWFEVGKLPFDSMWVDDPHWLPKVLDGKTVEGYFHFTKTGDAMISFKVNVVDEGEAKK